MVLVVAPSRYALVFIVDDIVRINRPNASTAIVIYDIGRLFCFVRTICGGISDAIFDSNRMGVTDTCVTQTDIFRDILDAGLSCSTRSAASGSGLHAAISMPTFPPKFVTCVGSLNTKFWTDF